jgi:hypothetical protein
MDLTTATCARRCERLDSVCRITNKAAIPEFVGSKGQGLHAVTEDELRDTVSPYWVVDDITPAVMYGLLPDLKALPPVLAQHLQTLEQDDKGRIKTPAWRLTAHR